MTRTQQPNALNGAQWELDFERQQEEIKALYEAIKVTARRNDNYRTHTANDMFVQQFQEASDHDATVAKRINSAEEKLKRIEADPILRPPAPLRFQPDFDAQTLKGRHPLVVNESLTKAFSGDKQVLDDVTFTLGMRDRVVIVGVNGAGKSTLLKIITGAQTPDNGSVYINPAVHVGVLDQEGKSLDLKPNRVSRPMPMVSLRNRTTVESDSAQIGLVPLQEDFDLLVGQLSSGQRRKLKIARAIAERANLLLLDEPTNHVSFDVLEALGRCTSGFSRPHPRCLT